MKIASLFWRKSNSRRQTNSFGKNLNTFATIASSPFRFDVLNISSRIWHLYYLWPNDIRHRTSWTLQARSNTYVQRMYLKWRPKVYNISFALRFRIGIMKIKMNSVRTAVRTQTANCWLGSDCQYCILKERQTTTKKYCLIYVAVTQTHILVTQQFSLLSASISRHRYGVYISLNNM